MNKNGLKRIGLISDTHIPEAMPEIPKEVLDVFKGVDMILHAGDMHAIRVLDWLERIAPVLAARGNGDGPGLQSPGKGNANQDPRIKHAQVVESGGLKIGVVHDFPFPEEAEYLSIDAFLERDFGGHVDVVVCGHTHLAKISEYQGILIINPGSPTLPNNYSSRLGNVGILEIEDGKARAEILQLGEYKGN